MDSHSDGHQLSLPFGTIAPRVAEHAALDVPEPRIIRRGGWPTGSAPPLPIDLTDAQLLTRLLGPATSLVCERLATIYESFRHLAGAKPSELRDHGLKPAAIERLCIVFEIAKRFGEHEFKPGVPLRGSQDIYAHFREHLAAEVCEYFYAVLLDNKHRKLRDIVVSQGSLTASIVHPRDVFAHVVRFSAAAVIFVHNHPSGDPTPSQEDIDITRRLREVGDLVGVRVLDHIVIGKGRYVSFVDDGYWS
ncbi:MAG: DNA repair protein RadC [Deltaproteobacteria bacterium]|nr:DNA repair protein RadC [Deltaproteobacteria bacterium]MBI3390327.1 DNA repair protein RadC [Deltaproteobacteria bacterium]